ncbi:hypothetical protein PANT_9d00199 [Moesziomyces antarcticus T-34]|uniref:GST N-terminal domain-containing protein n=1 Tax=Pseudozyma antarctica (strain T-34) TaxID=1151754 RepID=M9LVC2_PSEA3|nr:hypothetical protein PANT_9d00199 [Moesziomyces antarcticus T-34]
MTTKEEYTLFYWPDIPGRGEFVRLCFEKAGVAYKDNDDVPYFSKLLSGKQESGVGTPHFAVPILGVRVPAEASDSSKKAKTDDAADVKHASGGTWHYISQTPAILNFLAPRLGLLGDADRLEGLERDVGIAHIQQLCATAFDLNTETHDTHHPVSVSSFYDDQKAEAKKRSADFRQNRLPKFLGVFELALHKEGEAANTETTGRRLVGTQTTVADLSVYQVIDGLLFAFPKCMQHLQQSGKYDRVFAHHDELAAELKHYLESDRRRRYSNGIFRHYPELDDE